MADVKFGTIVIPGRVLRGFIPEDPELAKSIFHPPSTSANVVITLGLHVRRIILPMVLFSSNWNSYQRVYEFLRNLEVVKSYGREQDLKVPILTHTVTFERCFFDGFKEDPRVGILEDVAGTLPGSSAYRWFTEGVAVFVQAVVVKTEGTR